MKKINQFIYWTPRILSIIFILFLTLFSLDVFEPGISLKQALLGLLIHNIPTLVLLAIVIISWRHEIVGGIAFILAGTFYLATLIKTITDTGFQWYYLSWAIQISGIAFFIGILFLIGWLKKKKLTNQKIPSNN
ncbi:MAG TPA: hypothetical protein P5267_00915 [Patescibacteria group bacterium]|nr:hypothetical protein [Patescibacteria group bacterium]